MKTWVIITSINGPEHGSLPAWRKLCKEMGWRLCVVADRKTPKEGWNGHELLTLDGAEASMPLLHRACGVDNYARKNLGYLKAMRHGAQRIFETDDDNWPEPAFTLPGEPHLHVQEALTEGKYFNHLRHSTLVSRIWPRGYPLSAVNERPAVDTNNLVRRFCPVQQMEVLGEPDVDAIFRLTQPELRVTGYRSLPVAARRGTWSPFNSQGTVWFPEMFPAMYIPVTCDHRADDIWRGYVAQRAGWERGDWLVAFTEPQIRQERNAHDLHKDLASESRMYVYVEKLLDALALPLKPGVTMYDHLRQLHSRIVELGLEDASELHNINAWEASVCA